MPKVKNQTILPLATRSLQILCQAMQQWKGAKSYRNCLSQKSSHFVLCYLLHWVGHNTVLSNYVALHCRRCHSDDMMHKASPCTKLTSIKLPCGHFASDVQCYRWNCTATDLFALERRLILNLVVLKITSYECFLTKGTLNQQGLSARICLSISSSHSKFKSEIFASMCTGQVILKKYPAEKR